MPASGRTTQRPLTPRRRPADARPTLVVVAGARAGTTVAMQGTELLIGKDPTAHLHLPDSGVSRHHAKVLRAADGIHNLVDLDSTNGVLVNGVRVEVAVLREGDRIHIGPDAELRFTYLEEDGTTTAAPESSPLSERQLEVARLVCDGLSNPAIADKLGISRRTVTSHLDHIYTRLGIGSRAELAKYLAKRGLT